MPVIPAIGAAATYALYAGIASVAVSVGGSLIQGSMAQQGYDMQAAAYEQQAAYQRQQAEYAVQIGEYNAEMQRQNAEVSYQLALYQSEQNQALANMSAQIAMQNASLAEFQALGAQQQYEQGIADAEQQKIEAEASRRQGEEEARRTREENDRELGLMRAQYAASGVTSEGSPLEVLGDAAKFGELAVQDIAYSAELESRKQYKEAEIAEFEAGYHLIDKMGFEVEQSNYMLEAQKFEYEADLYAYDSAIAGAAYSIDLNEAKLTELSGGVEAWGFESQASASESQAGIATQMGQASLIGGYFDAAASVTKGASQAAGYYGSSKVTGYTPTYSSSFGGAKASTSSSSLFRW